MVPTDIFSHVEAPARARIVSDPRDSTPRPATRSIADAIAILIRLGEMGPGSRAQLVASKSDSCRSYFSALSFKSLKGDQVYFALPISKRWHCTDTGGLRISVQPDHLHNASVDEDGNIELRDGGFVRALTFDVLHCHFDLPELEEAIVYLTIRYLGAEEKTIRVLPRIRDAAGKPCILGIDYAKLPELCVPSVKVLTRYINGHLGKVPRKNGATPFNKVSVAAVHRTLDLVGIRKNRGRPKHGATSFP